MSGPPSSVRGPSLAAKLTIAFVAVGLTGTALVAVFVGVGTRRAFDRFVNDSARATAVEALEAHYAVQGAWTGVEERLRRAPALRRAAPERIGDAFVLADAGGRVVVGDGAHPPGSLLTRPERRAAQVIEVDGVAVGYVLFGRPGRFPGAPTLPEAALIQRIFRAIAVSALAAAVVAVLLGGILARTISEPIGRLTDGLRAVSGGSFGIQVPAEGSDEIGEMARSFNAMSAELERSRRVRRQMTADIAHDLRTPLTVIAGYAEGLADGRFAGDQDVYRTVHEEALHLQRLVDDLRTLSLADAGELELQRVPTDPAHLVDRARARFAQAARDKGVTLRAEAPGGLPSVHVDPERLAQVLGNLVDNALSHTGPGGSVVLAAEAVGEAVRFAVEDTGEGIAAEDLPHVFERHYRADRSRTSAGGASGLGLAIAKSIVVAHGGAIAIDSTPGEGTRVTVTLPARDAEDRARL